MEDNRNSALLNKYEQYGSGINKEDLEIYPRDVPGGLA
jgi:hypothetical protein